MDFVPLVKGRFDGPTLSFLRIIRQNATFGSSGGWQYRLYGFHFVQHHELYTVTTQTKDLSPAQRSPETALEPTQPPTK